MCRTSNFKSLVFLSHPGLARAHLHFNLIKIHQKIIFTKNIDFYIFESQKCKMNENYPKTLINFAPLKCSYLG